MNLLILRGAASAAVKVLASVAEMAWPSESAKAWAWVTSSVGARVTCAGSD